MYYIGIDPGSKLSGLAILDEMIFVHHKEYEDPVNLWLDIVDGNFLSHPCRIALEDMVGSGRRDENINRTMKVLGYLQFRIAEYGILNSIDLVLELVVQQFRLAYVSLVPKYITGKDEKSAAAHALALRERNRR